MVANLSTHSKTPPTTLKNDLGLICIQVKNNYETQTYDSHKHKPTIFILHDSTLQFLFKSTPSSIVEDKPMHVNISH